jgi:acetyl-CoA C-acetyltransferase
MVEAFLVSAVRTPIGKYLGSLSELSAPQLGALVVREAVQRAGVAPEQIEEVILGQVLQAGVGQNPARQAALQAGLPDRVAAVTINKVCGSGLKAVMLAAQAIRAGDADLIVAGGMESMSQAPYLLKGVRKGWKAGHQQVIDAMIHDGLWCAFENWHMGQAAEATAARCGVSRQEQDRYAAQSHQRAAAAWERGAFQAETVPVPLGSERWLTRDEGVRPETTPETLSRLRPVFQAEGTVTAGNASLLSDGAAALVVASAPAVRRWHLPCRARLVAYATAGGAPRDLFLAPVAAIHQVLRRADLRLADVDLIELNEAFAAQMVACLRELHLEETRVNVHGGAIALGHPIGASGARVLVTLLHALEQRGLRRGLAALCLGGGNAVALIVERP